MDYFIGLFSLLLICLGLIFIITRSKTVVRALHHGDKTYLELFLCILFFLIPTIVTSELGINIGGIIANIRTAFIFSAAVVGGPICGLIVGSLGAVHRYSMGGISAFPCSLATFCGSVFASGIAWKTKIKPSNLNYRKIILWIFLVFIWENIHLCFFIPFFSNNPYKVTLINILSSFYVPQVLVNTFTFLIICILIFDFITNDPGIMAEKNRNLEKHIEEMSNNFNKNIEQKTQELKFQNNELYLASVTDTISGLYNHNYFKKIILEENSNIEEGKYYTYSIICIDIDNFKYINDTYGHTAGDHILKEFALLIASIFNGYGLVFRTGGDEFTILLGDICSQKAHSLSQKILSSLNTKNFLLHTPPALALSSNKSTISEQSISISCSIGIHTFLPNDKTKDLNTLFYLADQALLASKAHGKHCITYSN
ncbi:MAG: diguanylate cyclase [Eubacteriales bacterium]